jgi:NitT/TauT family transport system substrate-binding protein
MCGRGEYTGLYPGAWPSFSRGNRFVSSGSNTGKRGVSRSGMAVAALFLLAILGLEACGKGPAGKPIPVRLSFFDSIQAAPVFIALEKGFFREAGVDVQPVMVGAGKEALEAVAVGRADFGTAADLPIVLAILAGEKNLAIVATIQSSSKLTLVVARKDRGIRTPADLRGKRIAVVGGAVNVFLLHNILVYHGVKPEEVRIVDIGNPNRYVDVFHSEEADAASTWYPYAFQLLSRLENNGIVFYGEGIYRETFNLVGRPDFLRENPEAVQRVLKAFVRTTSFIQENPEEARRMVAKRLSLDEESLASIWNDITFNVSLDLALIGTLETEARWAVNNRPGMKGRQIPGFLDHIHPAPLEAVRSEGVTLRR